MRGEKVATMAWSRCDAMSGKGRYRAALADLVAIFVARVKR